MSKQYSFNGLAGCVAQMKVRQTDTLVGIYHGPQAGMEEDPSIPWQTVCEVHNTLVGHPTLALARSHASDPKGWCEECREPMAQDDKETQIASS